MQLHDLLEPLEVAPSVLEVRGDDAIDIRSITHDSRAVSHGALFCCIPGGEHDGHAFAAEAVASGAVACLVERPLDVCVTQVQVRSVRSVLGPLCDTFFSHPSRAMRVLGVTGTNGKTTTTYLLEAIATAAGDRTGVVGTTGARLGGDAVPLRHTTPEATELQQLLASLRDDGAETIAMEVSSHALDQHRVDGTTFTAACFTNLSHDHLDYHGTADAYFEAKARLFTPSFTANAVIGIDDDRGEELVRRARERGLALTTYALDRPADVTARGVEYRQDGLRFELHARGQAVDVRSRLLGRFNVLNALAAAATAVAAGFALDAIRAGLSADVSVPGRMERIDDPRHDVTVFVDYAHTPDALAAALHAARGLVRGDGRLLVVFGCGGDRDRAKRPEMGAVATQQADIAILTSDNPRSERPEAIAEEVLAGVPAGVDHPAVELDRRRAIRAAVRRTRPGDVVMIAGKGHETGQTSGGVTQPFDDRSVAREELAERP